MDEFLRCLLGLPSNTPIIAQPREDSISCPNGNYYYRVMPFGLKNARFTYQRIVTRIFETQIGRNMEAYIDDMVVKSKRVEKHLANLGETLSIERT